MLQSVQTYNNVLHVYGLHTSKEQLLPSLGGSLHELRRMHVYLQHSTVLEQHGTDKTRLLQAQIWVKHITDRPAMNEVWSAWLPEGMSPARACVEANMADERHLVEIMVTACK